MDRHCTVSSTAVELVEPKIYHEPMRFELQDYHRNTEDSGLVADLRRVAAELGKSSVTIDEYNERGRYHNSTLSRRFGSWFGALERAGLSKTRNLHITNEEYFKNLEAVWVKLGRQPRYGEMHKPLSEYSAGAYEGRFGTWRNALEEFMTYVSAGEVVPSGSDQAEEMAILKHGTPPGHSTRRSINWRLRWLVMRRDNFKCIECGRSPATSTSVVLHVDHRVPWSKGGETLLDNLQTLCSVCNIGKSNLTEHQPQH
jgi:hypothetical protein